ncbi:hypothetical protein LCGC14_3153570, partial [marine sediment metagenome]
AQSAKSQKVFEMAFDKVRHTKWFDEASRGDIIQEFFDDVNVNVVQNTNFLRISMTGRDRNDITDIVNAVAEAAEIDIDKDSKQNRSESIARMTRERTTLLAERERNIKIIATLHERGLAGEMVEDQNTLMFTQQSLVTAMSEVRGMFIQAFHSLEAIKDLTEEELASQPEVQQMLDYDYKLRNLEIRLLDLKFQLQSAKAKFGDGHQQVKKLVAFVKATKEQLDKEKKEVIAKSITSLKEMRQSQFLGLQRQHDELSKQIETNSEQLKTLGGLLAKLEQAEEASDQAERNSEQLGIRLMDLRLLMDSEEPLVLHRRAQLPRVPSMPKYIIMIPAG